ncbi:MAG TPA: glycosyltransferase family 2 protein [Clostridia bacterium]|nr:glycosyltransferase family 2 protein [Clostridia bacterium]
MADRLGVVVVNWEQAGRSLACLSSVLSAGVPDPLTVLVDNGSTESLAEIQQRLPSIHVVRLDENRGYAAACNAGASHAIAGGATHLLFLNNDTTLAPGSLSALMAAGKRRPDAILAPKIVYSADPTRVWSAGGVVRRPWMVNSHLGQDDDAGAHSEPRRVDWATGCALFCSAATLGKVGPFDEGLFLYMEDLDWCLRATRLGVEIWYEPTAVVLHEVSASAGALPRPDVLYYGCRNTYRVAFRHSLGLQRGPMAINLAWTLGKVAARNAFSGAHRRDALYRARTRALIDLVTGRKGPAPRDLSLLVAPPPAVTAQVS